jgi:hypothetical protein
VDNATLKRLKDRAESQPAGFGKDQQVNCEDFEFTRQGELHDGPKVCRQSPRFLRMAALLAGYWGESRSIRAIPTERMDLFWARNKELEVVEYHLWFQDLPLDSRVLPMAGYP